MQLPTVPQPSGCAQSRCTAAMAHSSRASTFGVGQAGPQDSVELSVSAEIHGVRT